MRHLIAVLILCPGIAVAVELIDDDDLVTKPEPVTMENLLGGEVKPVSPIPRLCGQILVGTAGFEPGVAAEWTFPTDHPIRLRPEAFISRDGRPGIGGAVLWQIPIRVLPKGQELFIGPRCAYHNADDIHGELDGMAIYSFPIIPRYPGHHHFQVIAALGLLDKDSDVQIGASVGAAYVWTF
jgi:hypothetical protein